MKRSDIVLLHRPNLSRNLCKIAREAGYEVDIREVDKLVKNLNIAWYEVRDGTIARFWDALKEGKS